MGTVIVGIIVLAVVGLALYSTLKSSKKGGCGCGCAGCDQKGSQKSCH